ncbi:hypothetical protein YYC_03139 [Plasmodium yoelii 17X]|uniref:Arp2/3 complex 34 kDa subunit n=3 Tax=Plasmodium yoelii TaxID=5861 RepID=A0AAE9WSY3_PLAYO|nr:conserved Plasmodium protein, unknown function [Plasmodium yoelii]ETB59735.1 hypothetical protein YYC_03139 [Plasmodium yoelii 17X]WBY57909.1 hypothetical protein Py17XNL_001002210 [Plasmodium yoelii yoelii]CDU84995.1 conserved Plasmodium protein, unknown function [Plasmodium yoelii]VTZ78891.1 conserved Plasmodium protein, unknown function [Plasmodium yoelii]|eukprot:XP_728993.2 conserved Plasmodium protein, unknown function [Plasmodium yoelii]
MCEVLYKKIKETECESNLHVSNNKILFDWIYKVIKDGIPVPSSYYSNEKIVDKETNRYVLTEYIYDADNIIYKVEAHTKIKLEKIVNARVKCLEEEYLINNEVEKLYLDDKYNELDSIQIYISYNNFSNVWNEDTMQYFIKCYNDNTFKTHIHILEKEEFGYDLQIELYEIPKNPIQSFLTSNHLSRIREALLSGPFMHFFLTKINLSENILQKFIIRKNEVIYITKIDSCILIIISIHYQDIYDKYIVLGLCKNIHLVTKTMDLSGNLDCTFYSNFPSHLISPDLFIYDANEDRDNYDAAVVERGKKEGNGENGENDENGKNGESDENGKNGENEEDDRPKFPNVGFMSIKVDVKLFNNCKEFSELIKIASRISHIIVSFREFLNNSLVLYRIKQRRSG